MEVKNIPLGEIVSSPMNPRKTFDEDALRDLAENIRHQGLLQPITVRPLENSGVARMYAVANMDLKYEIVCGERRFRAFQMLHKGKSTIPAIVREMTDAEAFDAMITENLQRKDVDPTEEAYAFKQLIENGSSVEEIAARFGKSTRFVTDRVKLNSLIPALKERVKEGTMAIAAAMIVCKFDEGQQNEFCRIYSTECNITKGNATNFANRIFMRIKNAAWSQTPPEVDFAGSCGKCSECPLNTANESCLFYDEEKAAEGQCTSREKFYAKHLEFLFAYLEAHDAEMVKQGEPLEFGKTVIIDTARCWTSNTQRIHDMTVKALHERGYAVVKPEDVLGSPTYFNSSDEAVIQQKLQERQIYRCMDVLSYDSLPSPKISYHYVKHEDDKSNATELTPPEVTKLVSDYKSTSLKIDCARTAKIADIARDMGLPGNEEISSAEQFALDVIHIYHSQSEALAKRYGYGADTCHYTMTYDDAVKIAEKHPEDRNLWAREYLRSSVKCAVNPTSIYAKLGRTLVPDWKYDEYMAVSNFAIDAKEQKLRPIAERLKELGYDTAGNKSEFVEDEPSPLAQYDEMKNKHPDALLLFSVGDFYECYRDDAKKAAEILRLPIAKTTRGGKKCEMTSFPRKALDEYLPKLVRSGCRVAICEHTEKLGKAWK